jgi:hypothetical protein
MTKNSYEFISPDIHKTNVDPWRFSQYLRIANVITHLFLPDDLIIDSAKKRLSYFLAGYRPRDTIRHLVWHLACSLYTRSLMDKSFFLADHKHLDICEDRKKVIELLHSVENFDSSYFACLNTESRAHRKLRQIAYRTDFAYCELDLSTLFLKSSFTYTEFSCNFSLPEYLLGKLDSEIEGNKRAKRFIDLYRKFTPRQSEKIHSPMTLAGIVDNKLARFILGAVAGKFTVDKFNSYPNLIFPSMIKEIEIRSDEDFLNDIRRAKASIIEKSQKKRETFIDNVFSEFKLYGGKVIDLINSPLLTATGILASILAFLGISPKTLARIAGKKREDIIHVKTSPDGGICITSDDEVLLELHEPKDVVLFLAVMLRSLSENEK